MLRPPLAPFLMTPLIAASGLLFRVFSPYLHHKPMLAGAIFGFFSACMIAVFIQMLWEVRHPKLKVRSKLPKPETALNLGLKSTENIRDLQ